MSISVKHSLDKSSRLQKLFFDIRRDVALLVMTIPGMTLLLINSYLPMFGVYLAFVDFRYTAKNYIFNLFTSKFIGLRNFEFMLRSPDTLSFVRNTLLYGFGFIILGLITAIPVAIALSEVRNKSFTGVYQSILFLPQFFSWVVVAYLLYAFINYDMGFINRFILTPLGFERISFFTKPEYWPGIFAVSSIWKGLGVGSLMYLAAITSIDPELYQAAIVDGAGKWKQITNITIPHLFPLMTTLTLLSVGKVFFADFGMFFQLTGNYGILYPTTLVIDTYVYNAFKLTMDMGMSTAAGLSQSIAGFICILGTNLIVRRVNKPFALF